MKFSLILATLNRTNELKRFFLHLNQQNYKNFEVLLIDQNTDNRLESIVNTYRDKINIKHIKSSIGLSHARNEGLKIATGDIFAFPDDDCWYPFGLLKNIYQKITNNQYDGYTGRATDENNIPVAGNFGQEKGILTLHNVWTRGISISIFLSKEVVHSTGFFDEGLGLGSHSPYGSGEETDYLLKILENGYEILYDPEIIVHHPKPTTVYNQSTHKRGYSYGCGFGYVLKKHNYPIKNVLYHLIRPLGGSVLALLSMNFKKFLFHYYVFWGRLKGFFFENC